MNGFYTDYAEYMRRFFPDYKVQKISVNTDAGCPNRDGTLGRGGCIYCDNTSFTPAYCFGHKSVSEQIEAGKRFFSRKYPDMRYLVYFQSYTGTHRKDVKELEETYMTAAQTPGVVGLIIGTRPDCLPESVTDLLSELNRRLPVFVELGVESMHDSTLRAINRGHDSACSRNAIISLAGKGLHTGVHLIAGLPGESAQDTLDT
ncbi:MAG: TIGR01212 family radical SAM protein, partial [Muribaculaceae bacterium]|nr:TIGR01212 family radical SAM protein [Muribaculaceae bacterium]